MSQLPVEDAPGVSDAAHEAATGRVVHLLTGIGRSTIDRILAASATGGAINGPSGGGNDH